MVKQLRLLPFFLPLLLLGAGCVPGDFADDSADSEANLDWGYCMKPTPWGSCIYTTGIDDALLGSWRLISQTVIVESQTITNPFSGRGLEFRLEIFLVDDPVLGLVNEPDLVYEEDFSTDVEDSGECVSSGTSAGKWSADIDLDMSDPSNPVSKPRLTILTDPGSPLVECEGSQVTVSATPATPLGVGAGATLSATYFTEIAYDYAIVGGELILINTAGGIVNVYTYSR